MIKNESLLHGVGGLLSPSSTGKLLQKWQLYNLFYFFQCLYTYEIKRQILVVVELFMHLFPKKEEFLLFQPL